MKNIIRTYNLTVRFSKFTFNTKIYEKFGKKLSSMVKDTKNYFFG